MTANVVNEMASQSTSTTLSAPRENGASSADATAELIRTLDTAFAEMSSFAATAARDADAARKNARAAAEIARLYRSNENDQIEGRNDDELDESAFLTETDYENNVDNDDNDSWGGDELKGLDDGLSPVPIQHVDNGGRKDNELIVLDDGIVSPQMTEPPTPGQPRFKAFQHFPGENNNNDDSAQHNTVDVKEPPSLSPARSWRKSNQKAATPERNRNLKTSSVEKLAMSHAEDVLSLSLELERAKQALARERDAHSETQVALTESKSKKSQEDVLAQNILREAETDREDVARKMDGLQQELLRARVRVEAAEEDAQLALDMAKDNAESREQMEDWLQRSLQEVQVLREQLALAGVSPRAARVEETPQVSLPEKKAAVHFADVPTAAANPETGIMPVPPKSQAAKSMVAAGRTLLQRARAASTPNGDGDDHVHTITFTPQKSAERRERLRERLRELDQNDLDLPKPSIHGSFESPTPSVYSHGVDMGYATKAAETCKSVSKMVRESGLRLGLGGHWFRTQVKAMSDDLNVEAMTRHYCHSVEVKLDRRKDEVKELESLCDYLERQLVTSDEVISGKPDTITE